MTSPKLLLVEDELLVALDVRRRLESAGYTVCGIAMSGDEAIAQARELKPHLVLMDIQLQGDLDGIETADIIRTQLDLPVIFVTANADASTRARAQATAPFNFLVKPIKERELTFSIEMALHHHSAQKQLREMRDELETRVELRTAAYRRINNELKNEVARHSETVKALELARDDALSASRAKSQFLACISHELRTPMNGILGMTEVMLDETRSDTDRDCLSVIRDSAESLLGLINNLLDYSKAQAGKIELTPCSFDLRNQFNSLLVTLEQHAREKKLQLTSEISPDVPALVMGDPLRLAQILINLVGNAIKFTDRGEIDLQIGVRARETARICIEVSVRDTGIGIPEEKQRSIFEPFTQADNSDTRRHGGAGLGLSICEQLVALMGGRIWLRSKPGHGSTFHFLVWLEVPEVQTHAAIAPFPTGQKTPSISA
jgi:signal transduction histidine kinase